MFLAGGVMLWLGWVLLPVRIGAYLDPDVFPAIRKVFRRWIWLYRVHLFGHLVSLMAFVALGTQVSGDPRLFVWPGVAVLAAGILVAALASAFYYHFGAWGAVEMGTRAPPDRAAYASSLRVPTEYVTCLTRFGRVFFGLGQLVLAAGLLAAPLLPAWLAAGAGVLGVAAMAMTMGLPDELDRFSPVFHLNAAWLVAVGIVLWIRP
jgi:hypothetical protein